MKSPITSLVFLITLASFSPWAAATEYGCPIGVPAQRLADDYNRRWVMALNSGNAEELGKLYADNAVLMPPTDETIVGRAPIGSYLTSSANAPRLDQYTVDIVGCEFSGDSLQFAGVWGTRQIDYRGKSVTISGNVLRILDRQANGSWQTTYEIWN